MKKLALTLAFMGLMLTASASSLRYFTYSQALRTVNYLNTQNELMIYAGYEYEIETYVLLNEAWAERVNSQFFEIWIYGYDAYTGEEIMMPIDLSTVWLFNNASARMYSAATYLRFHNTHPTPTFRWMIPPYNPYTRPHRPAHFVRTYHYEVHCYGWMPPAPHHNPYHYHSYYMRRPDEPVHYNNTPYTPGTQRPTVTVGHAGMTNHGSVTNSGSGNGNKSTSVTTRNMVTNPGHATVASSRTSTTASGTTTTTRTTDGTVTNTTTRTSSATSSNSNRNSSASRTNNNTSSSRATSSSNSRTSSSSRTTNNTSSSRASSNDDNTSRSSAATTSSSRSSSTGSRTSTSGSRTSSSSRN
ncbi:MAG: hypothetical protein Q4D03_06095 [Bacteroidales bacterium]|nr:hypothetical protein [Bacteroidales bacterium]